MPELFYRNKTTKKVCQIIETRVQYDRTWIHVMYMNTNHTAWFYKFDFDRLFKQV